MSKNTEQKNIQINIYKNKYNSFMKIIKNLFNQLQHHKEEVPNLLDLFSMNFFGGAPRLSL